MKRLALFVALLWWAQIPVCLLAASAHVHGAEVAADQHHHGAGQHHHDGHSATPAAPEPSGGPGDSSCAEHCASLAQAAPVATARGVVPHASFIALLNYAHPITLATAGPRRADEAFREPLPDPSRHSSVLRL